MAYANSLPPQADGQSVRFAQIELPILSDPRLSPTEIRVLSILLAHRNARHGKAWPKRQTVADKAHVHPETVTKATARLVSLGYLIKAKGGNGRGHVTVYTFPLSDQRQAKQTPAQTTPSKPKASKAKRGPGAEKKASRATGFSDPSPIVPSPCPAAPSAPFPAQGTEKNPQPYPSPLDPAPAEPEAPRGESFAAHPAEHQETSPAPALPSKPIAQQAASEPHQATQTAKQAPRHHLAFPEALPVLVCVQLARMLEGTPEAVAQELLDEMSYNSRCYAIINPAAYMRRLLGLYKRGEFAPEVAHFERERREKIAANERAKQLAEKMHLEALAQGRLPPSRPIVFERSEEETAKGLEALAAMKAMLRGGRPA